MSGVTSGTNLSYPIKPRVSIECLFVFYGGIAKKALTQCLFHGIVSSIAVLFLAAQGSKIMTSTDTRWTDLPILHPSSIGDLLGCSKKYDELRVKKNWPPNRPPMPIRVPRGSAWHECLRSVHAARWTDNQGVWHLPLADLEAHAASAVYSARYEREVSREDEVDQVLAMTRLFLDNQDYETLAEIVLLETQIEFSYSFKNEKLARISATIDRILIRGDRPDVVVGQDFKSTTGQSVNLAEAFLMIWCLARKFPGKTCELEYIFLDADDGQVCVTVITQEMVRSQHKIITQALLRRLVEPPTAQPGNCCTFCILRDQCQGLDAVDLEEDEVPF